MRYFTYVLLARVNGLKLFNIHAHFDMCKRHVCVWFTCQWAFIALA